MWALKGRQRGIEREREREREREEQSGLFEDLWISFKGHMVVK